MAGFRTRARRLVARYGARPRRALVRAQLRRRAARQGYTSHDLERLYRYLSDHLDLEPSQFVSPLQQPSNFFPGLRSQPVYDPSEFPWASDLVRESDVIRQELLDFSAASDLDVQPQNLTDSGRWNVSYFYVGGERVEATRRACPRTSAIIDSIPGSGQAGQVYLSVLRGGTHIKQHFGPTNARLRCHLGLVVPDGARIRIGEEMYEWQEGQLLIFDDSFEHEVWNESSTERVVLIVDFWHPDLRPAETWGLDEARRLRYGIRDLSSHGAGRP